MFRQPRRTNTTAWLPARSLSAYVQGHERRLKLYLVPFFGRMYLSEITAATVQEYRDRGTSYDTTTQHGRTQGATFP